LQDMLFNEKGVNWNDTPVHLKRGFCIVREACVEGTAERHRLTTDLQVPTFTQDRAYILNRLPGKSA